MVKTRIALPAILMALFSLMLKGQHAQLIIPFEEDSNTSASYYQTIDFFESLTEQSALLKLESHGTTDSGYPLHLAVLAKGGTFDPQTARQQGKLVLFINNAIHPGEPCGVDATMILYRDIIENKQLHYLLDKLVIVNLPFYNISGGLRRGRYHRANQIGPESHGFRGNAKNLDLNRDFIKCDSRNARTFNQVFARWQPDVFIDNHTSNGADYPYTISLIATQPDKLDPHLAEYMEEEMLPVLYRKMKASDWEMTPYVFARSTPDEGIAGFLDLPRYASGYAALHNTIGFICETHMLKPFQDRVNSTYAFMKSVMEKMGEDYEDIRRVRDSSRTHTMKKDTFELNWELDFSKQDQLLFKGYEAKYKPSEVSGLERLWYDRAAPYEKEIPYYKYYRTTAKVAKPVAYIFPQAYQEVLERLQWNGVEVNELERDTTLEVEMYYIRDHETVERPYEGHYLHSEVAVEKKRMSWGFRAGDLIVYTNQPTNRYIIETLEPQAPDSFFAWNFFDGILRRKEYFSSYVFEDLAAELLRDDPKLRAELEAKRAEDEAFAQSARAQLDFVYRRSPYSEPTFQLYPVARIISEIDLPIKK